MEWDGIRTKLPRTDVYLSKFAECFTVPFLINIILCSKARLPSLIISKYGRIFFIRISFSEKKFSEFLSKRAISKCFCLSISNILLFISTIAKINSLNTAKVRKIIHIFKFRMFLCRNLKIFSSFLQMLNEIILVILHHETR